MIKYLLIVAVCYGLMLNINDAFAQRSTFNMLKDLKSDSVNLFQFNVESSALLNKSGLLCDTSLVNVHQQWAFTVSKNSHKLPGEDINRLLTTIKNIPKDHTSSDPTGCYTPRMGIVFFKGGAPMAHVDVCLECDKIKLEIFTDKRTILLYEGAGMIGHNTKDYFQSLCLKYKLHGCKF